MPQERFRKHRRILQRSREHRRTRKEHTRVAKNENQENPTSLHHSVGKIAGRAIAELRFGIRRDAGQENRFALGEIRDTVPGTDAHFDQRAFQL